MGYELCNGVTVFNLHKEHEETLDLLVDNVGQADDFVSDYLMDCDNENIAVIDYRLDRIVERNLSLEEFKKTCSISIERGLKELFMKPIKLFHLEMLTSQINNGKLTIESLFNRFKEEPRANLLRLLL